MKILIKDWIQLHPEQLTSSTDLYYTKIANQVFNTLSKRTILFWHDEPKVIKEVSLRLTGWFEDVISDLGIWKSVITEYKKRYGTYLPFSSEYDEYYPNEVNYADIYFLLWHELQQYLTIDYSMLPNHDGLNLAAIAKSVYKIFDDVYETAPENTELKAYLTNYKFDENDVYTYRKLLEWFHFDCYINRSNNQEVNDIAMDYLAMCKEKKNVDNLQNKEFTNIVLYTQRLDHMLQSHSFLISFTSPQWISIILSTHIQSHLLKEVTYSSISNYKFLYEDEEHAYVSGLGLNEGLEYKIAKDSFHDFSILNMVPQETFFFSSLIHYAGCSWHTGMLKCYEHSENSKLIKDEEIKISINEVKKQAYHDFLKATKGERISFFKNKTEAEKFVKSKIQSKIITPFELLDIKGPLYLYANPEEGACIQDLGIESIKHPNNQFYRKEIATKEGHHFVVDPGLVKYQMCCYMIDEGMLEDARFQHEGDSENMLFQENIQFLADYFHRQCRELHYL